MANCSSMYASALWGWAVIYEGFLYVISMWGQKLNALHILSQDTFRVETDLITAGKNLKSWRKTNGNSDHIGHVHVSLQINDKGVFAVYCPIYIHKERHTKHDLQSRCAVNFSINIKFCTEGGDLIHSCFPPPYTLYSSPKCLLHLKHIVCFKTHRASPKSVSTSDVVETPLFNDTAEGKLALDPL